MEWLADNWQAIVTIAGTLMGGSGFLAWMRFRRVEAPRGAADLRGQEAENYQRLLELVAEQGTQIARMSGDLDKEREKRRELEDRVEVLEDERKALAKLVRELKMGIKRLLRQLEEARMEPVWTPEE